MLDFEEIEKVMEDCEEIKKVMKEGFDIFLANTGIDEKVDDDDTVIIKIEDNFRKNKKKLINDEEKFQEKFKEVELKLSKNEELVEEYFFEILKTQDSTTIMALHSYYIETLKSYVDKFKSLQIGGDTFTNPESGVLGTTNDRLVKNVKASEWRKEVVMTDEEGNESIPEAYKNAVVVPEEEELKRLTKSALYFILTFFLLGLGIASEIATGGAGGGFIALVLGFGSASIGKVKFDIAKDKFIDDFQGLSEEELKILTRKDKKLPPNGLIRGAFSSIFSNLKERVKNIPSATKNYASQTASSAASAASSALNKLRNITTRQRGGEIDDELCKSIQNFMKDN